MDFDTEAWEELVDRYGREPMMDGVPVIDHRQ